MGSAACFKKSQITEGFTDRLYIRSFNDEDFIYSLSLYSDPLLTQFYDHGKPRNETEVEAYIEERESYLLSTGLPFGIFSVFLRDKRTFIGQIDVVPTGEPGEVEIGWIFLKEYQNQGYCSEAVNFFLIPFIKELAKKKIKIGGHVINRVIATAHPDNKPSQRIMEKIGLSFYKTGLRYNGNPRNWYELNLRG
jgi:RimJ/RimL family protein N-acetyltransferase